MQKEKRTRGITDVLLILVITILVGTVLIIACGADPAEAYSLFSEEFLEHRQDLRRFL